MQLSELGIHADSIEEGRMQAEAIINSLSGKVCIRKIYLVLIPALGLPLSLLLIPMRHAVTGVVLLTAIAVFLVCHARESLTFNGAAGEFVHRGLHGTETFTLSEITEISTQQSQRYSHRRVRSRRRGIIPTTSDRIIFKANGKRYSYVFREYQYLYPEKIGWIYEDLDKLVRLLLLYEHYFLNPPPSDPNAGFDRLRQSPQSAAFPPQIDDLV